MYEIVLYTLTFGVFDKSIAEAAKKEKVYLKLSGLKTEETGSAIWVFIRMDNGDKHCVGLLSHTKKRKDTFYIDVTEKIKMKNIFGIVIESKNKITLKKWKFTDKKK